MAMIAGTAYCTSSFRIRSVPSSRAATLSSAIVSVIACFLFLLFVRFLQGAFQTIQGGSRTAPGSPFGNGCHNGESVRIAAGFVSPVLRSCLVHRVLSASRTVRGFSPTLRSCRVRRVLSASRAVRGLPRPLFPLSFSLATHSSPVSTVSLLPSPDYRGTARSRRSNHPA